MQTLLYHGGEPRCIITQLEFYIMLSNVRYKQQATTFINNLSNIQYYSYTLEYQVLDVSMLCIGIHKSCHYD